MRTFLIWIWTAWRGSSWVGKAAVRSMRFPTYAFQHWDSLVLFCNLSKIDAVVLSKGNIGVFYFAYGVVATARSAVGPVPYSPNLVDRNPENELGDESWVDVSTSSRTHCEWADALCFVGHRRSEQKAPSFEIGYWRVSSGGDACCEQWSRLLVSRRSLVVVWLVFLKET